MPFETITLTTDTLYLMGFSFVAGSLVTILALVALDVSRMLRARAMQQDVPEHEDNAHANE